MWQRALQSFLLLTAAAGQAVAATFTALSHRSAIMVSSWRAVR